MGPTKRRGMQKEKGQKNSLKPAGMRLSLDCSPLENETGVTRQQGPKPMAALSAT